MSPPEARCYWGFFMPGTFILPTRNRRGASMLDIQNIPLAELGTLILTLMDHLPPGSQLRRQE